MTHTPQQTPESATTVKTKATKTPQSNQKTQYQTVSKLWELRFRQ
ncbi:MAG: hypothetical protein ACPG7F_19370 [Aggregatilineales bacterium]